MVNIDKIPSNEQILIFSTIAKLESFSATAKKLNMPATSVGRKLQELENLLGVELVHRSTRKVQISNDGKFYLKKFENLIHELENVNDFLNEQEKEPEGVLKITVNFGYGLVKLRKIINKFHKDYPNVKVILSLSNEYKDLILDNFDLAIRLAPFEDSSLIGFRIDTIRYICVTNQKYFKKLRKLKEPEQLENFSCIGLAKEDKKVKWTFYKNKQDLSVNINPRFTVNDPYYVAQMLTETSAIAYVPDFLVKEQIKNQELVELFPELKKDSRELFAIYHSKSLMPASLKVFLDMLKTNTTQRN
ncbi:MAG: LysR family transcriptional regulator [Candidatus Caenarcaniphilales bacterium]|nr:LysR family transcriptional regulator [Candidatus Caenarcaniphilales bacterium]